MRNKIYILSLGLFSLVFLFIYNNLRFNDGRLHVVFCEVGQGDAVFIRTPGGTDILVDGGPDDKILACLSSHMPFWDRKIEAIFVSHPDADHITGLYSIVKSYQIDSFYESKIEAETKIYSELERAIKEKKIVKSNIVRGDKIKISDGVSIDTLWPSREYIDEKKQLAKNNKNLFSLVQLVTYKNSSVLLTGDIEAEILDNLGSEIGYIDVFKLPHHGAKTGIDSRTFQLIKPGLAVISVGKNNKYGHPAKEVITLLEKHKISYKRTDNDGEVEIVISNDGKTVFMQ